MSGALKIVPSTSEDAEAFIIQSFKDSAPRVFGMAMAPARFFVFEIDKGDIITKTEDFIDHKASVYHWVAFSAEKEVSAIRNGAAFDCLTKTEDVSSTTKTIEQSYILWGDKDPKEEAGWLELRAARIGTLHVPKPVGEKPKNAHVVLQAREYVAFGEFGNAYISGQRLMGFGWIEAEAEDLKAEDLHACD